MDRFEAMAVLLSVVDNGSLSAAGRKLGMPLATVSRRVSDLETHIGTRLLHRSTRQLTLTDAGRAYVASCRRILDDVGESERAASGEYSAPRGELVISAPIVFGRMHLLPVVTAFLAAYPEVDVRLTLSDRFVNLQEEHIDLAVRIGVLPDSNLIATRVGSIRQVVCASPEYLARRGTPKRPEDLKRHDCITFEGLNASTMWKFGHGKQSRTVTVRSRLVLNMADPAIAAAIAGAGVVRALSYQFADALRAQQLKTVLRDFESESWPVSLVHASRGLLPLKLRAFLDFAAPRLRERVMTPTKIRTPRSAGTNPAEHRRGRSSTQKQGSE